MSAEWIRLDVVADWKPLRSALADVETTVTFAWAELDELVGGLPRSAYAHNAFWKGARSGWAGFMTANVRVGESVTFVRVDSTATSRPSRPADGTALATGERPDVILVGCVKTKLPVAAPAADLYVSALFSKERAYAESAGVPWFILSAQHALVSPDAVLEPYDLQLNRTSREHRREWGRRVINQLTEAIGSLQDRTIEIHAGSAYTDALRGGLTALGARVSEPLAGLTLGTRLAWYSSQTTSTKPPSSSELTDLIDRLTDRGSTISPQEFLETGASRFRAPGLYSWWVDSQGAGDLGRGLGLPVEEGLIYAGLAGATRAGGRKSKNTLWGRIKTMHLGGRHEFSTFRLSLGSILAASGDATEIDEEALTIWMHDHLRLIAVPVADADTLGGVETEVLSVLNPPLNLDKVPKDPRRQRLTDLRKRYGRKKRRSDTANDG